MSDDILKATGIDAPTVAIDGKDHTCLPITVYDRAKIQRDDRNLRKQMLLDNLRAVGAEDGDIFQTLQGFDKVRITENDWLDFINSPESALPIFVASLELTYPGEGLTLAKQLSLPPTDALHLRVRLCGLSVGNKSALGGDDTRTFGDGGNEGSDPTTPPGATFGTNPTGNSTGTKSGTGSPDSATPSASPSDASPAA